MEPITRNFKRVQKALEHIEVIKEPGLFHLEDYQDLATNFPESFNLTPEQAVLSDEEAADGLFRIMTIAFYDGNGNSFDLNRLTQDIRTELKENLSGLIEQIFIKDYLNKTIDIYKKIENQIIEDDVGIFKYKNIVPANIDLEKLDKKDKGIYDNFLAALKKALRVEIRYLNSLLININKELTAKKDYENEPINENVSPSEKISPEFREGHIIRSFKWERKESFNQDMLTLYLLLKDKKIISDGTDFKTFSYAFSNIPLHEPLKIKWFVTGKNRLTSKSSLFHFISRLEDYKLIDNNEWYDGNNMSLYHKIAVIFVDKEGQPFGINGLKSSRSQGLTANCAMQNEIDIIVKTVDKPNTDNFIHSLT